jgi:hypothetical protein
MIRQQVDPYAAQQERMSRQSISDAAERQGPLANIQGERRLATERAGQASGQLEAQLIGKELGDRRTEIQNALSQRGAMLSQEQQQSLQRELAQLDAALRQQQINSGNDQFLANLGLQSENQNNYWDAIRSGLL